VIPFETFLKATDAAIGIDDSKRWFVTFCIEKNQM